ncbi:PAAR domain-containing protein [Pseudomonas sp. NPDC012596]|uniref:PAAR domain-containing protein n=1 Tax=Pseudomonas sp. NPDC012596 TaxID=3364419 RepID=UPI0029EB0C9F|nr:PAAR domain-containing protein [Pseudomonas putida]HYQ52329.1 PAAR domain-containing protein [Pseudomonas sp.]
MRPIILLNDPTDRGGMVVQGSPSTLVYGRAVARLGDKVMCLHGACVIASGDTTTLVDGKPVARQGDKTACGSSLIATNSDTGIL